jgi:hypothetical protein
MTHKQLMQYARTEFAECVKIMENKNYDYSYGDDALTNFKAVSVYGVSVVDGFITRMTDKMKRISNLSRREGKVKDEKIIDTIRDHINYLMLLSAYLHDTDTKLK